MTFFCHTASHTVFMNSDITPLLLQLVPRTDLNILIGRWGYQPRPDELPAVYQEVMDAALRGQNRFWLQDIRRREYNDPQTTLWLLNTFFPDMANRLGGRLYVAYLVGPTLHQSIVNQPDFIPAEAYNNKTFVISFFGDEGAAIKWLQENQGGAGR